MTDQNAPVNWFQDFFAGLAVEFWRVVVPEAATAEEVAFLWKHLALSPGGRVLDVPCGHGRLSQPLAARGCAVTGVDLSREFLKAAGEESRRAGLSIDWRRSDMRRLPFRGSFDAAFCMGNSFGYLEHAETERFLRNVHAVVRPRGRWVIDTGVAAESLLPHLQPERTLEAGGVTYGVQSTFDPLRGRLEQAAVLSRGPERRESAVSYAVYTVAELRRLLEAAGWTVLHAFGGLDREPFALGDRRLLLVAIRS